MRDPKAMHFDGLSAEYAEARPPYPASLWRDVLDTGLVAPGRRALDLGAGTGQATKVLLGYGMDVVAVEPGANLAAIIEERFPHATVVRARAEDVQLARHAFDLVVIATAIHWMDPAIVLPIIHESLKVNGRLLVWRNVFGDGAAEVTPFRREVQRIVAGREAGRAGNPEDATVTADMIAHSGLFAVEGIKRYSWTIDFTTDQVRSLFSTFSDWTPGEVAEAASIVDGLGGRVKEHYTSWLILATPLVSPLSD